MAEDGKEKLTPTLFLQLTWAEYCVPGVRWESVWVRGEGGGVLVGVKASGSATVPALLHSPPPSLVSSR